VSARAGGPALIVQVPRGGAVAGALAQQPPAAVAAGELVVEVMPSDSAGALEAPARGEMVLSVPSPESLTREREELARVLRLAGTGVEPLVIAVEAAEQLRDEQLAVVLEAARRAPRPVILRIIRDA